MIMNILIDPDLPKLSLFDRVDGTPPKKGQGYIDLMYGQDHSCVPICFPFRDLFRFYTMNGVFGDCFGLEINMPIVEGDREAMVFAGVRKSLSVVPKTAVPVYTGDQVRHVKDLGEHPNSDVLFGVNSDSLFNVATLSGHHHPLTHIDGTMHPFDTIGEVFLVLLAEPVFYLDLERTRQATYFVKHPSTLGSGELLFAVSFQTEQNGDVRVEAVQCDNFTYREVGRGAPPIFGRYKPSSSRHFPLP